MPTPAETKPKSKALPILLVTLGTLLVLYTGFAAWLRVDGRFPFRTTLNGRDVSLRRALDVQRDCMENYYPNMRFEITDANGVAYTVTPDIFDFSDAERAVRFLPDNTLSWPLSLFSDAAFTTSDGAALEKLAQRVEAESPAFGAGAQRQPENAYLRYDEARGAYDVVPETEGAAIDTERFESALAEHVLYGGGDFDLTRCYRTADVRADSPALLALRDELNAFAASSIDFKAGEITKKLEARMLLAYLRVDGGALTVHYDAKAAAADGIFDAFAAELSEAFDSPGITRDFRTHDGALVPVRERTWRAALDREKTAEALAALTLDDFTSEGSGADALVWSKAPLDALANYVEVDLTNQQLYLYTDGALVLKTPIVSGSVAQRHTTPAGAFSLIGKSRNVTLRGPGYASFVRWWMPFNNRIGLHDASWRGRFGGTIYKTNGSHGCINLPRDAAEAIYETIDDSYAVVCYWRPEA